LSPTGVTLQQVFYLLVSEALLRNVETDYKKLSALTAKGRREGSFPALIDMKRTIDRLATSDSLKAALRKIAKEYRRDPLEGQEILPVIGADSTEPLLGAPKSVESSGNGVI
jgi:hypothetical protein